MDWTQVFVILGVFAAGYFHLSSKIDNLSIRIDKCASKEDLSNLATKIDNKTDNLTLLIIDIRDRLSRIEGQLMPKVISIPEEKLKKKAKGE